MSGCFRLRHWRWSPTPARTDADASAWIVLSSLGCGCRCFGGRTQAVGQWVSRYNSRVFIAPRRQRELDELEEPEHDATAFAEVVTGGHHHHRRRRAPWRR